MRILAVAASVATFVIAGWPAQGDDLPDLNVDSVCRGSIAQQANNAEEKNGPDLAFARCVENEEVVRQKLRTEWPTFTAADKATCIGPDREGFGSYSDLATCLETARNVRKCGNRRFCQF